LGHKEIVNTACPGRVLNFRQKIIEIVKKEEKPMIDASKVRTEPLAYSKEELSFWDNLRNDAIKLIREGNSHWVVNGLLRLVEREHLLNIEFEKRKNQVGWEAGVMEKTKWPQPESL